MRTVLVGGTPRRRCTSCGRVHYPDPKVAVGTVVITSRGLLLVRRAREPEAGRWSLPGGYLDAGEDPRVAAARETREEAGVDVTVGALLDVLGRPGGAATLFLVYAAEHLAGEPTAGDDADAAGYFGPDDLPELAFTSTRAAVGRWLGAR